MHRPGDTCPAGGPIRSPGEGRPPPRPGAASAAHPAAPRPRPLAAPAGPARSGAAARKTAPAPPGRRHRLPPSFTGSRAPAPTRLPRLPARLPGNRGRGGVCAPPPPLSIGRAPPAPVIRFSRREVGSRTFSAGTRYVSLASSLRHACRCCRPRSTAV